MAIFNDFREASAVPPCRLPSRPLSALTEHRSCSSRACHGARGITRAALHARFLVRPYPCGGCGCSEVHITQREGLAPGLDSCAPSTSFIVGRAAPTLSATLRCGDALARARQLLPHLPHAVRARAPPPRGIGKRAREDSPRSTRERFALPTRHTLPRGQPLWQIVLRAYHGARAALYARFLDQPHPCGGCGCSQVHSSRRQALARGLHSFAPSAHRRPRHADAQRDSPLRRRSLLQAHGSYCHHPHAVHTRASTKGHRQKSP